MNQPTDQAKSMDRVSISMELSPSWKEEDTERTESNDEVDIENNASSSIECTKGETKQELQQSGDFFAKMGLLYALVAVFYIVVRVSWLCHGYWWSRNSVAEIYGVREASEYTPMNKMALNIHAFMGLTLIAVIAWQHISANFFASKHHERLRQTHRITGRVLAVLWPCCIFMGIAHEYISLKSKSLDNSWFGLILSSAVGCFSLGNMVVGYFAIAHRPKDKQDFLLHKAGMFFSMHYAVSFTLSIAFICAVQLAFPHCDVLQGQAIGYCAGFILQSVFLFTCMYKHAPALFSASIVKANAVFLLVHHILFLVLLYAAFFVSEPVPGNCFA